MLESWSRRLLAILRVRVAAHNAPAIRPERCQLVANHVSWLDIFAVYAVAPSLFVAKSDIRGWPVVGALVARVGTLFIERGNRRHARATNDAGGRHRRELAAHAREVIARELDLPPGYSASGTPAGPRGGSPSAPHPTHSPYPAPADPA